MSPVLATIGAASKQGFHPAQGRVSGQAIYSAVGTYYWTVPGGVTQIRVTLAGGGGAGGVGVGSNSAAGGGGAGGALRATYNVTGGESVQIDMGEAGSTNGANGEPGTATTVTVGGASASAGGGGGSSGVGGGFGSIGGAGGGTSVTGAWTIIEARTGATGTDGAGGVISGAGASFALFFGISGVGGPGTNAPDSSRESLSATGWGAGGAGSYNRTFPGSYYFGGTGANGYALIEWGY